MSRVWNQSRTTSGRRRYALYSRPQQQDCRHHSLHQLSSSPFVSVESCCRIHRNGAPAATTIAATRAMMLRGGSSSSTMEKGLQQEQQQQQQSFAVEEEEEEATVLGKLALRPSVGELVVFKEGKSPEQLRAAAYLRAMCFYTFPEGRSEEALKLHCKMKAEDEWSALKSKVAGLEQRYKRIACILALCPLSELADSSLSVNPSCKVVLANGEAHSVVGSLDLNQGIQIPGQLSDDYSEDVDAEKRRGYLSNVCVAPEVRKQGVGAALLQRAQEVAHVWGVTDMYVHVLANNQAALMLYTKGGFLYENEEMTVSSHARMQLRPHCLLLHKRIQKLKST